MKLIISIIIAVSILTTSCSFNSIKGSKKIVKKEFELSNFENIEVESLFTIKVIQSDEFKVEVECNENIEKYLVVEAEGDVLKLSLKGNNSFSNVKCIATVSMPNLNDIESSGATKINFIDFTTERLNIEMSGASKINGNVTVDNLNIDVSGASKINLTGDVVNGKISTSGASKMSGDDLIFQNLDIDCSGASKIVAHVKNALEVELSGASKFDYYGDPNIVNQDISGVGKINQLN